MIPQLGFYANYHQFRGSDGMQYRFVELHGGLQDWFSLLRLLRSETLSNQIYELLVPGSASGLLKYARVYNPATLPLQQLQLVVGNGNILIEAQNNNLIISGSPSFFDDMCFNIEGFFNFVEQQLKFPKGKKQYWGSIHTDIEEVRPGSDIYLADKSLALSAYVDSPISYITPENTIGVYAYYSSYSYSQFENIDLHGGLGKLRQLVTLFANGSEGTYTLIVPTFSPTPYETFLRHLEIRITTDSVFIQVQHKTLIISGASENLKRIGASITSFLDKIQQSLSVPGGLQGPRWGYLSTQVDRDTPEYSPFIASGSIPLIVTIDAPL